MSDDLKLPDGNPIASFEDIVEFLSERASLPCSSCGHNQWSVFSTQESKNSINGFGIVGIQFRTGNIYQKGAPLVVATCKKCAYMKLHSFVDIAKWVAAGKPEFTENAAKTDE